MYRMSHRYWANFWSIWVHKRGICRTVWVTDIEPTFRLKVPEYGSRFLSTGLLLGIYLGPGSQVQIQVPEYREIGSISVTHTVCPIDIGPISVGHTVFRSRFPSTGPGSQVRVQIPSIGSISVTHTVCIHFLNEVNKTNTELYVSRYNIFLP